MVLYQLKNPETVDILLLPDGSGMIVKDGKAVPITKAEIEAQYVPVPLAKQG
jgi:hypothetical protein